MVRVDLWYTNDLAYEYGFDDDPARMAAKEHLRPTPKHTLVHSFVIAETDDQPGDAICNDMFAAFNRGSGREDPALDEKKLRSLSMGDIVSIKWLDGRFEAYTCASAGWRRVESWERA